MSRLVQQHGRAFRVVNRKTEKVIVESYDFERKVRGRISIAVPDVRVQPVVGPSEKNTDA